uniref:Uncharacterized protein n=1 Tax=Arundo donax TaxID=35708 RepID=A0A0A8Y2B1_ARUDO
MFKILLSSKHKVLKRGCKTAGPGFPTCILQSLEKLFICIPNFKYAK